MWPAAAGGGGCGQTPRCASSKIAPGDLVLATTPGGAGAPIQRSYQGVEDSLNVLVLLELVDQGQDLGRLLFGQLRRHGADVFVLR